MRAWAISKRVTKELLRDKRSLALMFLAPILILSLMKVVFNSNSTIDVNIATVNINSSLVKQMDDQKHVSAKKYSTKKSADKALKDQKVDSIIQYKNNEYYATYANNDPSKTSSVKMTLKSSMSAVGIKSMQEQIITMKSMLPESVQSNMPANSNGSQVKIHNSYIYGDGNTSFFDKIIPILMGFFVFFFVFLISGMALLKERTTGTLDRLLATPVKRSEIVFGYMLSYGMLAVFQTLVIVLFTILVLQVQVIGNILLLLLVNLVFALVALAFGLLMSTFARSEFQLMQFIPLIVVPQIFFSGLIPLDNMASWVRYISYIIPLNYAGNAMSGIVLSGDGLVSILPDIGILLIFLVVLVTLNIQGLKRYRKV
ncbi:ABC transporter permease [Lactobacillus terrae]|uniref:ABC transporter permease n=1 Tax=Lactobacillus terrae TaxID=2269374 RepID=UPI000C1B6AF2|nr:ABC transporter permease [Lactobacillus terrae]